MSMRVVACLMLLAAYASAAERRVIGLASDGKTPIEILVREGYSGLGGRAMIAGLKGDGDRDQAISPGYDVVFPNANPIKADLKFPPSGRAYIDNREAFVLWNWLRVHAPDQVSIFDDSVGLEAAITQQMAGVPGPTEFFSLHSVTTITIPQAEIRRRLARSPSDLADQLARVYGHDFNQLTYLPGMALLGQIRLGHRPDVIKLADPYLTPGRDLLKNMSSLTLAGHMVFGELARRTGDKRYTELVKKAADLGFSPSGQMLESMPFHNEMSDSFFMAGPITAMAGKLTGQRKYFDMVVRHFKFMDSLVLRDDGLYRHSPLANAAWGRGNAFPALGMALALSEIPDDYADRRYVLDAFRALVAKLRPFQDADGMWHEVIDNPASYQELSATMMIATAMERGIRRGWLDAATYQPVVDRAWRATLIRVAPNGDLIDVSESTNKQPTYSDYMNRIALSGKDERGGGMALFFATEMAGLL